MATIKQISPSGVQSLELTELSSALKKRNQYIWIDLCNDESDLMRSLLVDQFNIHSMLVGDVLQETHIPKINIWDDYLYVILAAVVQHDDHFHLPEIDIFLGRNYLITFHDCDIPAINRLHELLADDEQFLTRQSDYLLFRLVDLLADDFLKATDRLHIESMEIEDDLLEHLDPKALARLTEMRRVVRRLEFFVGPQRQVLAKLAILDHPTLSAKKSGYRFENVNDHFNRIERIAILLHGNLSSAMETYLSLVNNRMSAVMKALAIISTIVLPLSLITSFFGMNFFPIGVGFENWTTKALFTLVLVALVAIPTIMIWIMRRNRWL